VMVSYVDKHRRKSVFQIGDLVKCKVSPMRNM
jgi:exosome complex RNA-binding protein Rrp4